MNAQTAEEAWSALWTCPHCGAQRQAFCWDSTQTWQCACGSHKITRHEWDIYLAFLRGRGFAHIDPNWLAMWNRLPG